MNPFNRNAALWIVIVLLLAGLVAAFTSRWVLYAGLAAFAIIGVVDLLIDLRGYLRSRRKGGG